MIRVQYAADPQFLSKFESLQKEIVPLLVECGIQLLNEYKTRIFVQGQASDNTLIQSRYSTSWAKRRVKRGRQIQFVDLYYTGELEKSIQLRVKAQELHILVNGEKNYIKVKATEERNRKKILDLQTREIESFQQQFRAGFRKKIQQIF